MTSANVMGVNSAGANQLVMAASSNERSKQELINFASFMNGNYVNCKASGNQSFSVESSQDQKTQYSYRDNSIEPARTNTLADKISSSDVDAEEVAEEIVDTVAEDLHVSTEEVEETLAALGMTAYDLLIPENLVQFTAELTGQSEPAELLLNEDFVDLMQDMNQMGIELLQEVGAKPGELEELVAEMDILEEPAELTADEFQTVLENTTTTDEVTENTAAAGEIPAEEEPESDAKAAVKTQSEDTLNTSEETVTETKAAEETQPENYSGEENETDTGRSKENLKPQNTAGEPVQTPVNETINSNFESPAPETYSTSYLDMDTMDIIDQIAENARTQISEGTTTMEMQLNPENLGRIYLQISAKEGAINASITASNEAVRAALEAQIADLKQNLNQAGVKVDAIEVTVASHEFERNLEQNAQGDRRQGEREEAQAGNRRRNLSLDSLGELSGIMSEEEALVAQIMRDNGNSVDLTA